MEVLEEAYEHQHRGNNHVELRVCRVNSLLIVLQPDMQPIWSLIVQDTTDMLDSGSSYGLSSEEPFYLL
jgi:hypothetical protein